MRVQKNANKMKVIIIFLAVWIALWTLAQTSIAQESKQAPLPEIKLKSEKTAMTWSLLGTLIPWGLFLQGLRQEVNTGVNLMMGVTLGGFFAIPIGPSLGFFYAGSTWRGLAGIGIRALGCAGLYCAFAMAKNELDSYGTGVAIFALVSTGVVIGSSVYDITQVKNAVRKRNLRTQEKSLAVVPLLNPRSKAVGIQVQFSF